jgi:hypothetical protein
VHLSAAERIALRYPVNTLVSFHYYQRADIGSLARAGHRMIGDSGAFSAFSQGATIDADTYAEWATRNRTNLAAWSGVSPSRTA